MKIDFEALFAMAPNPYIVLDPQLRIVWMNEAYLRATMRTRQQITGLPVFDAFPSDPQSDSHWLLKRSFAQVLKTGQIDEIALIRYDIRNADGSMDARFWSCTHTPLVTEDGQVALILQHTVDVTELHSLRALRDEMGVIQRAQALQARNRDLVEESDQLRALLEEAPGFVAVLGGPDHVFQMANRAYRELVGQRDLAGKSVAEALPEVVEQGFVDLLNQVRDTGQAHMAGGQKVLLRNGPGGTMEERFLDFIYQPIVSEEGRVAGVFVQGHDVTEQISAQRHQDLLINELNHRVKNTLAIVQGLATQSFRKSAIPGEGLAAFSARLAALAGAHNLLTRGNWEGANFGDVVVSSIGAVAGVDLHQVSISGPAVTVSPQMATAVAMVVHELATNALKYGALADLQGRIDVSWSFEAECQRRLVFDWLESGGPEVTVPTRQGFGTRLVKRGFVSDLHSHTDLEFLATGLKCQITALLPEQDA
ncbi:PAS domain-containing protein [Novosphingobium terrae]|uniref:PAS domain-containing protein n=1 Tax=Novosphingobium terrae TaxID=2726189 RepID=UPI001F139883|nr:PAS domain-containing protein [Novosphingobium terrae]